MNIILTVVKLDNKFDKVTAQIKAVLKQGILAKTIYLYSESDAKVGETMEMSIEDFNKLNISKRESKSNPGRFFNVLTL